MPTTTAGKLEIKKFDQAEEVRRFEKGRAEIIHLGGMPVARATFEPGWKWSTCMKPNAGTEWCEIPHAGYMLSGKMMARMKDGTEKEMRAGEVAYLPAGHDGWVIGEEPAVFLDFQGMENYAKK